MKIGKWWNDANREIEIGLLGQNPVLLPLCRPQNPEIQYLKNICASVRLAAAFIMLQSVLLKLYS
jgi:hypothetical protein